jgi:hypothetical protein
MTRFDRGILIIQLVALVWHPLLVRLAADVPDDPDIALYMVAAGAPFVALILVDLATRRRLSRSGILGATTAPVILQHGFWLIVLAQRARNPGDPLIGLGFVILLMPLLLPASMLIGYRVGRRFKAPA